MVALRNVVCSDRWEEAWSLIAEHLRLQPRERAQTLRARRQREKATQVQVAAPEVAIIEPEEGPTPVLTTAEREPPVHTHVVDKPATSLRRPAPDHHWRRMTIGRAQRAA